MLRIAEILTENLTNCFKTHSLLTLFVTLLLAFGGGSQNPAIIYYYCNQIIGLDFS
jgi:hypothetical protein